MNQNNNVKMNVPRQNRPGNSGNRPHRGRNGEQKHAITKSLKFIPLGGVDDINRNCYVVECGKDIVVIDLGLTISEEALFGVNYLVPDVDYLVKRKNRIAGIVLSHAHLDHIGAIAYLIKQLGFPPIFAREFTALFLRKKLEEFGLDDKVRIKTVKPNEEFRLGALTGRLVPITHSIPQSSSVLIKTPMGNVFYSGDFKFDDSPVKEPKPDYEMFRRIGQEGVSLALLDSTNIYHEGKAKSESEISEILEKIVASARGRVIAATFSSLGTRLHEFIEIAKRHNRKIAVTGRSMKEMIALLRKIGYLSYPDDLMLQEKKLESVPDEKLLILTTGSQGETSAGLSRMARGEHLKIKIKKEDTVVLSSSVIPGNAMPVQHLIDDLTRLGAKVIHQSFMDVHTSGHGYQDDIRKMYELIKPDYVAPVHGWPSFLHESAYLLNKWGMKAKKILLADTGRTFTLHEKGGIWQKGDKIHCKDIYVSGSKMGESVRELIEERMSLAESGFVVITAVLNQQHRLVAEPWISTRGVIDTKDDGKLLAQLRNTVKDVINSRKGGGKSEEVKRDLLKTTSRIVEKYADMKPVIEVQLISANA